VPNGNTLGLIVRGSKEWNATILMDEELGRFRISGIYSGVYSEIGGY
jgi:hypothetical protein